MNKKTVFVGMSGGVDSSVSAALLKKQGYEVVGVFIRTWHPEFLKCNEEEERRDAMRVAAHLDIPFLTFNLADAYKKEVADYMIAEYKKGRTPNPDVMCNKEVKFGIFFKKALSMGADYIATGHYAMAKLGSIFSRDYPAAQRHHSKKHCPALLFKGKDGLKDQSYFLWTLKQQQLNKILFPIGHFKKTEVRRLAKKFKLPVAEKKDSQGICFLGTVDLKNFLKHYIKEKKGKVINEKGEVVGYHNGVFFNTLGERHGFTITQKSPHDKPYYVISKDIKKNILIVNQDKDILYKGPDIFLLKNSSRLAPSRSVALSRGYLYPLQNTNWINKIPKQNKIYTAQIRYHGELLSCKIKILPKNKAEVMFPKPVLVASGQSCVVYDKNICLGGGVIV